MKSVSKGKSIELKSEKLVTTTNAREDSQGDERVPMLRILMINR